MKKFMNKIMENKTKKETSNEKEAKVSYKNNYNFIKNKKKKGLDYTTIVVLDMVLIVVAIALAISLFALNKNYKCFIIYIDGLVDSNSINHFVLEPLMLRNRANIYDGEETRVISEIVNNNTTIRKVKKFDLASYILNHYFLLYVYTNLLYLIQSLFQVLVFLN